jgi:hypothetical protein
MKNFHKLVLGLMVGAMAISFSAFTNAKSHKLLTSYYYNAGQQAWNDPSLDQTASNYSTVGGSSGCNSSSNICTYNIEAGKFVQSTEGTYHP